ncbi:MAG TPA: FAD-binding oxidoreductase [Gemmatimonadales bacterium]|nr:FAD-binding oxidoreductase [Gemmatimonadales bacterium]
MIDPPSLRGIYRTDLRARAAYAEGAGIYRIIPEAVAQPADRDDLITLIEWAGEHRVPLIPRGAGSAMGGGNVGSGVIVDLRCLGAPLEIDPATGRARTGAAVTLAALQSAAAPHGLRLPPDPSSGKWATLGGMVSTNASGARSVRYGSVRPWVQALTLVTTDGEVAHLARGEAQGDTHGDVRALARFEQNAAPAIRAAAAEIDSHWPRVRKNSSGYALESWLQSGDLLDLLIGSEGTLGFITEVEWQLDPIPPGSSGMRLILPNLDAVAPVVTELLPFSPSALELLDRTFLDVVALGTVAPELTDLVHRAAAVLLVEFERESDSTAAAVARTAGAAVAAWVTEVQIAESESEQEELWALRHAASPILAGLPDDRRSLQVIEDASVPVDRISDYIRAVHAAAARHQLDAVIFGHAGDGNIHVNLLPELSRHDWEEAVAELFHEVSDAVVQLGGSATGEHGDGRLRAGLLERIYGHDTVALFRRVKAAFDPLGILNPGIILPAGTNPIQQLKAGSAAVPLPDDIARRLREIERTGGYARSRLELA